MLMLLVQILVVILPLLVVGAGVHLALRAFERRGTDRHESLSLQERLERIEEELGRIAGQVERLDEGQQFTQRLLGKQSSGIPPVVWRSVEAETGGSGDRG